MSVRMYDINNHIQDKPEDTKSHLHSSVSNDEVSSNSDDPDNEIKGSKNKKFNIN